jgi:hypothetical protein
MPFGTKANADGSMINFDRVYHDLIAPAVRDAALEPIRADQALSNALANIREKWEPETTARNVRLIRKTRQARGDPTPFEADVEPALGEAAALP